MKAYIFKSIMRPQNGFRKKNKTNHCTLCVAVQCKICGFGCLTVNCFSFCFIIAQGESRRQRAFLELRKQTVSLVSNLLVLITSNEKTYCTAVQRVRETETEIAAER